MDGQVYAVVNPSGESEVEKAGLSVRLDTLEGKTVGLVWNKVFRGDETLPIIGELLQTRFHDLTVIPWEEFPTTSVADMHAKRQKETLQAFADALLDKRVDAVVAG